MEDEHFSHEVVERFFRSELSRGENREFVRHLLRRCQRCSRLVRQVAQVQRLQFLVRDLQPPVSTLDSGSPRQILDFVVRLIGRGRSGRREGDVRRERARDSIASYLRGRTPWTRTSTE